jgi:4-amino-4-deoxy-L-arabinose transferase-like glycosyltransferase
MTKKQILMLAGIMALAIFFRFYLIHDLPGGLFPDEAANGLDINLMQQGHLQPFYERGNGREALFFYLLWGGVALFGKGAWQHHVVSGLVGVVSVILCFLVARKLFNTFSEPTPENSRWATYIGLLSSFLMAVSTWHVTLSRTAFRANLIPLFAAATIYGFLLLYTAPTKIKRIIWSLATGAVFASGFYTYIAYRVMVPILIVALLWPWAADIFRKPRFFWTRRFIFPAVGFLVAFTIFIFPLAHYFYTHPGSFIGRSEQVSIFNPDLNHGHLLGTLGEVTKQSLLGYFYEGDLNWRHNVSGQPFLPWIVSPFFALGLIISTLLAIRYVFYPRRFSQDWKHFLLAGWFWGMLLPVITTAEGIPHGLRSIGTIPPVFILSAWGIFLVWKVCNRICLIYWDWLSNFKKQILTLAIAALKISFILALIIQAYFLYFGLAWASPEQYLSFRSDLTPVSNYLNGFDNDSAAIPAGKIPSDFHNRHTKNNAYLVLDTYFLQTVDYLTAVDGAHPDNPKNQPYAKVVPQDAWQLENLKSGDEVIFTETTLFDIIKFKQYHPAARLAREYRNRFGQAVLAVYEIP